ncbi:coproporphyrinogen dehydrogenase HemZ [Caproiciproducens faecalis]|uniref:Coproporphyrinogen dehydrogenase HemZ n=1 Tax=Caproiciproducens faecalis TaxID=2820301 RepID=A0ABS7DQU3_9FIRM|nr:coproporphyrinogen dehydrogenase HemZ [Caproiciproducens faecalis]MBW7573673.1 coproporphyrinogen dehydrogenase HemZ [Caproiciproducens faecalis]
MILVIDGHSFHYEMENLCRVFFPYQRIKVVPELPAATEDDILIYTGLEPRPDGLKLTVRVRIGSYQSENSEILTGAESKQEKENERRMAILLFGFLTQYCGFTPKWGILTGVRPVKLLRHLIAEKGEQEGLDYFRSEYLVSAPKAELSFLTMRNEEKILAQSKPESFSLYVSIPFCPTRCSYCSFVSSSVEKTAKLIPQYLRLLCEEIRYTAKVAAGLKLRLESVYIGGGTPTTLSAEQLESLLTVIRESFDLSVCGEFTVEAGRPDTITGDKLDVMKKHGVTRISINPQTLNDEVLKTIGRRHTTAQTLSAFALAREHGFNNINMDLIAGLPWDSVESFAATLDEVIRLAPESITVHTLALKRSSRIFQEESEPFVSGVQAAQMLDYADTQLLQYGYSPYYLYRQSRMVGNLENTGWAKPGFESPYNVVIMDESQTILACGAGAASKIKDPYSDELTRIFNFKYPYEYINRFEEMIIRKDQVKTVYDQFCGVSERT